MIKLSNEELSMIKESFLKDTSQKIANPGLQSDSDSMNEYEVFIGSDKLVHITKANKEIAQPMVMQDFAQWIKKRWPSKDPKQIITELNERGHFSESDPPTDLTIDGTVK